MVFSITTMLALLYGLLGQFSIAVLVTRIEETAIGAAIGILVASIVLPTRTRTTVRTELRTFLAGLSELVSRSGDRLAGHPDPGLIDQARELDRSYARLRDSAKPLTTGLAGVGGRTSVRHGIRVMRACDHYAPRTGPGQCRHGDPRSERRGARPGGRAGQLQHRSTRARLDDEPLTRPEAADAVLDAVQAEIDRQPLAPSEHRRMTAALRYLRQIDLAVVGLNRDLGADSPGTPSRGRTSRR